MHFCALMSLGLLGLAAPGLGGGEQLSMGAGTGAPAYGALDAPLVRSLSVESQAPASSGIFIPIHKPAHFPFVTIVKDDGNDPGGGWQEAKANLPFEKISFPVTVSTWYCKITIGMPIRHSVKGYISPATAASMSAAVTNSVASRMDFDLPQGIFCRTFVTAVKAAFPAMYPVGAKVGL